MNLDLLFQPIRKYFHFHGRARRSEYWLFTLFIWVASIVLMFIEGSVKLTAVPGFGPLTTLFYLAVLIPGLSVTFRRLHDTDRSAWWILLALIPFFGGLVLIVFLCLDGTKGDNKYGSDPKENSDSGPKIGDIRPKERYTSGRGR